MTLDVNRSVDDYKLQTLISLNITTDTKVLLLRYGFILYNITLITLAKTPDEINVDK